MAITNRELPEGTMLTATFKKEMYSCQVELGEDGKRRYRLGDGSVHSSPSAAGSRLMGGTACNGWRFWTVDGEEPVAAPGTEATTTPKAKKGEKAKGSWQRVTRVIRKLPNQKGVEDGATKWFCSACMKAFVAAGTALPEACPEGHAKEVVDDLAPAE